MENSHQGFSCKQSKVKRALQNLTFGLLVTIFFLVVIELVTRVLPESILPRAAFKVPAIAPVDRGSQLLRKRGYRGKRACVDCSSDTVRIITMGGSSTYGIPLYHADKTFSAELQRLLDTHRAQKFEVLNAGVAGFGIWQVIEALDRVVLNDRPDIIVLNAWFNDSSYIPGWYGYHDLSDFEAYSKVTRLHAIEESLLYQFIRQSRLYGALRYFLLNLQPQVAPKADKSKENTKKRKRRSNVKEFELGVEKFLDLASKHGFLPIFMLEPLNRTSSFDEAVEKNRYYRALIELAKKHDIPVIDSLTPLAEREGEWLFYDFIHPNEHGHTVLASAIFKSLFDKSWHTQRSANFFQQKGINLP